MESGNVVAEPVAPRALSSSHAPSRPLRLLVGYDGRPASRDALTLAKALATAAGAELTVASVRGYWPELLGESYELVLKEDEHWVSRGATKVLGDTPFEVRILAGGHETAGLRELAEAGESDIVVVGSTHRGRIGRVSPGSVGERLLSDTPCPLAVAPRGLADRRFSLKRIAIGAPSAAHDHIKRTGEGEEAEVVRRTATELAERSGASLRTLPLADTDSLIAEAATGVDLLVIGSRRRPGLAGRLLLDGPALRLTRTAPCPILIVPTT